MHIAHRRAHRKPSEHIDHSSWLHSDAARIVRHAQGIRHTGTETTMGQNPKGAERRWIILAQDGRHVTMGRAAPPSEDEVEAAAAALGAQGRRDGSPRSTATTGRAAA
jgi:hypothetical protein